MSFYTGACCCVLVLVAITDLSWAQTQTRCGAATQGGTARGADCVFPFEFKGTTYSECTDADHTKPWCYTASDKSAWGECIFDCEAPKCPIATKEGNGGGANCVFPFTYNGSPYYTCTSAALAANTAVTPWCATTSSYDTDQKWGQCIILTSRDNKPCVFPFTYNGQGPYTECVSVGCDAGSCDSGPWCGVDTDGTVEDSDNDPTDWGYCNAGCDNTTPTTTTTTTEPATTPTPSCNGVISTSGGTGGGAPCQFPFEYGGVEYSSCITTNNAGTPWCATALPYSPNAWGNCGACVDPQTTPTTTTQEPTTTPLPPLCPIPTTGGTGGGEPCVFPFTYAGKTFGACITTNYDKPWCATVSNYDTDGAKWGECVISDTKSRPCSFPFDYNGSSRKECITDDKTKPWCAVTPAVDSSDAEVTWGYCSLPVGPDCPEPSTSTTVQSTSIVTADCVDTFDKFEDTLSYLGVLESGVVSVADCEKACMNTAECQAYDWNTVTKSCYIHKGSSFLNFVTTSLVVDQYRRKPCITTTVTTTTEATTTTTAASTSSTTASTTSTTTQATTSACTDTFDKYPGVNAFGGQQEVGAKDEDSCRQACLSDENCAAFDLNGEKCFLHTAGYVDRLGTVAANTQYRRVVTCATTTAKQTVITPECDLPYTMLASTLALGGKYVSSATTVELCKEACTNTVSCVAIDFNIETSKCYWHTSLNDVVTGITKVNQYRKGECGDTTTAASTTFVSPDGCVDTFTMVAGTLSLGGSEVSGTTVALCQAACLAVPTCIAVDYNRLTTKCFWHVAGYESSLRSVTNVDQYRRVDCDATTTTMATTPTTTTTVPPTTTTTAPPTTTRVITTNIATTPTNNVIVTTPTQAFVPTSSSSTTTQSSQPAITCTTGGRFSLVDDRISTLTASDRGFKRTDIDSSLGKTVQDCGQKCCELVGCVAMDWRLETNGNYICYLLNGGYIDNMSLQTDPGSSHYRLT